MSKGKLILVATPIDDESPLNPKTKELLEEALGSDNSIILQEEPKRGRRRWLNWGLARDAIERFEYFNEHNQTNDQQRIINELNSGKQVYLISDCGLPAFCDPGQKLVDACHRSHIEVDCTPFYSSVQLALALSGFEHRQYFFAGFVPRDKDDRKKFYMRLNSTSESVILMDTAYRLKKVLIELDQIMPSRELFLGMDLNKTEQTLFRGTAGVILNKFNDLKREFVLCLSSTKTS